MMSDLLWTPRPKPTPVPEFPSHVSVYEVGPRDGLQAEETVLPVTVKAELCRRLRQAGASSLEITSFVPASWIPQLADAEELTRALGKLPDRSVALVPNIRGLLRAETAGYRQVAVVVSVTESFARRNLNTTVEGALERAYEVAREAATRGIAVRGYLSMAFGDPWEGHVPSARVAELALALYRMGCGTLAISDTIGTASPAHVQQVINNVQNAGVPLNALALHLHDTYGMALANVYSALGVGVSEFDTSVGGLGKCPYAPGAAGNLATEDLVWMLHGLDIETGMDIDALVTISQWMEKQMNRPSPSRVVRALASHPRQGVVAEPIN